MRPSAKPTPPAGRLKLTSEGLAWLASAAVLGLLGWTKSLNLLLMLAYVMVALLVLNGVLARIHANRTRSRRDLPPAVFAGETVNITAMAENHSSRTASVQIADRTREHFAPDLAPLKSVSFLEREQFQQRGRITLPPLVTISGFPFGFLRFERPESESDSIAVLPALGEVDVDGLRRWLLRTAGAEGHSRKALRRLTHDPAEVRGVRPYRPGDSLRAVHWRSSARRREMMVCEYDAAPSPELLLVVDPWLPANSGEAERRHLEGALSLAATIAVAWVRTLDARVTLAIGNDTSEVVSDAAIRESLVLLADAAGQESPTIPSTAGFNRAVLRAAKLIVSSRSNSPLAAALSRECGHTCAAIDSHQRVDWYIPPRIGGAS